LQLAHPLVHEETIGIYKEEILFLEVVRVENEFLHGRLIQMEQQNQTEKNERMTRVARCLSYSGVVDDQCNLNSKYFNEIACYNSLALAESCIKKIYKQRKDM
ncbi:Hypothetical protein BQ3484_452, partial [Cedratvirus A11]